MEEQRGCADQESEGHRTTGEPTSFEKKKRGAGLSD